MSKAIFIDKDAEFDKGNPYRVSQNLVTLLPQIGDGLSILQNWGYKIIVVSNQPGVARGMVEETDLFEFHVNLRELFNFFNLRLDGFYYCSHHPEGIIPEYSITCACRKPLPGLYFQAAEELNINLSQSWMIGDILKDVESGKRAGCRTLLINNGAEKDWSIDSLKMPDYITYDFKETAQFIISSQNTQRFTISA